MDCKKFENKETMDFEAKQMVTPNPQIHQSNTLKRNLESEVDFLSSKVSKSGSDFESNFEKHSTIDEDNILQVKGTFETSSKDLRAENQTSVEKSTSVYKDSMSSYCEGLISPLGSSAIPACQWISEVPNDGLSPWPYRCVLESDSVFSEENKDMNKQMSCDTTSNKTALNFRLVQLQQESIGGAIRKARRFSKVRLSGSTLDAEHHVKSRKLSNFPISVLQRSLNSHRSGSKRNSSVFSPFFGTVKFPSNYSWGSYCEDLFSPVWISVNQKYLKPSYLQYHTRDFSRCRSHCDSSRDSLLFQNQSDLTYSEGGEEENLMPVASCSRQDNILRNRAVDDTVFDFSPASSGRDPQQTISLPRKYLVASDVNNMSTETA